MNQVDPERFCYYPFMQMLLQPTGTVSPCCWNQSISYGTIPQDTLKEAWNSQAAKDLRNEFLQGNPVSCSTQMRHIGCHRWSRRVFQDTLDLSTVQTLPPVRFDVRLNGKCNLQCVMCDVWKQPNGLFDQSDFWTHGPREIFPNLKEMDVLGGEPFVQTDTFKLIDQISEVNKACTWAFVTNGSYKFTGAIRSRLDKIQIRWLQVSLDGMTPETYEKIRIKGNFERVLGTIEKYCEYRDFRREIGRPFRFIVSMCVQQSNWKEIAAFLLFAKSRDIEPVLQFAYEPSSVSLLSLSSDQRTEIFHFAHELMLSYGQQAVNPIFLPIKDSLDKNLESTF